MQHDSSKDTTIADIHRIREQMAAKFNGDLYAMVDDAQRRLEASGRKIVMRRPTPPESTPELNDPSPDKPDES